MRRVTADDITAARAAGRLAAEQVIAEQAPADPVLKIAWTDGHGGVDALRTAVQEARDSGVTWREIAEALGENENTVRVRYTQQDRYQRWKAKKEQGDR
jgi:DNA-binding NarL/FixJ family response regulator